LRGEVGWEVWCGSRGRVVKVIGEDR
jgi:hypothetical protein